MAASSWWWMVLLCFFIATAIPGEVLAQQQNCFGNKTYGQDGSHKNLTAQNFRISNAVTYLYIITMLMYTVCEATILGFISRAIKYEIKCLV